LHQNGIRSYGTTQGGGTGDPFEGKSVAGACRVRSKNDTGSNNVFGRATPDDIRYPAFEARELVRLCFTVRVTMSRITINVVTEVSEVL